VVNIQPLRYPLEAMQKKIEGTVAVELTFNASGNIVDSRVLSGPEELRAAALESALKGVYSINVARTLQVLVDFRLPVTVLAQAPPPPPPPPGANTFNMIIDHVDIHGLSEPQLSDLRQRVNAFVGKPFGFTQFQQAIREAAAGVPYLIRTNQMSGDRVSVDLALGPDVDLVKTQLGQRGAVGGVVQTPFGPVADPRVNPAGTDGNGPAILPPFGQRGSTDGVIQTPFGPVANPRANSAGTDSNGAPFPDDSVPMVPNLKPVSSVDPVYPPLARQARIQGVVVMRVVINSDGKIENIRIVTGHPLLIQAAIDAVKKWVYPTQSSQVATNVFVNFTLPQ
jgi:TonB family protein